VANAGLANRIVPLSAMAAEILRVVNRKSSEARELRERAV